MAQQLKQVINEPIYDAFGDLRTRKRKRRSGVDSPLVIGVALLLLTGLVTLFSASYVNGITHHGGDALLMIRQQALGAVLGIACAVFFSQFDYHHLLRWSPVIYLGGLVILLATALFGTTNNTFAKRWLKLPVVGTLQTSELAKIALILAFASLAARVIQEKQNPKAWFRQEQVLRLTKNILQYSVLLAAAIVLIFGLFVKPEWKRAAVLAAVLTVIFMIVWHFLWRPICRDVAMLLPFGLLLLGDIIFLFVQPHMSAIIIFAVIGMAVLYAASLMPAWIIVSGVGAASAAFGLIWSGVLQIEKLSHVKARLEVWLDPFIDPLDGGWQSINSYIAIGSGGFWGLGIGQSRQKHGALSECSNDFIFSVFCEEVGFIGALLLILLFAFVIWRGYHIARYARDTGGSLLATGIVTKFALQTLMNMFVVTGIMPVTGASLPLFSYGRTALILQLLEIGILLNVSKQMTPQGKG